MDNTSKKELKVVLSPELYDELRFVFRPETLENVIYKPEIISETKWQCSCGSHNEMELCPICGMEKNTVFSKINAGYLARHRKERIARKKKAMQDQQAMMAAQMMKKGKAAKKDDTKKLGALIGVVVLCIAIIFSISLIFGGQGKTPGSVIDSTVNTTGNNTPEATEAPDTTGGDDRPSPDDTTAEVPETTVPETTVPIVPVVVPVSPAEGNVATVGDGKWPAGASGNVGVGGKVHSDTKYDYIASNGITVLDKTGNTVSVLTENKALCITGKDNFIFYIAQDMSVHRIDTTTKEDTKFDIPARSICVYLDELYYIPADAKGLYACNFYGDTTKIIVPELYVHTVNCTAGKLYFSTDESLAVITSEDGKVSTFCPDGAKATSIVEITECIFYTGTDGKLKFYNPAISDSFGIEYPRYNVALTYVMAYENRVYVRTVDPANGAVLWIYTRWTPGTKLFSPYAFASTGVTTNDFYVSDTAVYDGNLYRFALS